MSAYFKWFGLPGAFVLTCLMSLLALVLALIFQSKPRWFCFAAMLLSSVGDIFLMRFGKLHLYFPNYFMIGAAFFMAAHLLYFQTYRLLIIGRGYRIVNRGFVTGLGLAVICFGYFTIMCMRRHDFAQYGLCMLYLLLISLGLCMIFSFAFSAFKAQPLIIFAALGALSFFASDLIIGLDLLTGVKKYNDLIWWLYPIGQILIILSVGRGR